MVSINVKKRIPDSLSPEEAWSRMAACERLSEAILPLANALDHCPAMKIVAMEDVPSAPRSFMDGFAVRSSDVASVPARLKLSGEIFMGEIPGLYLNSGEAMFIPTGGFLPEGADAVVMQEDTEQDSKNVTIKRSVAVEENVQRKGEDFRKGDLLFDSGHRLRPQDLSALATFGITEIPVISKPHLTIISTGNELVPFDRVAAPGQIRETNALALASAASKFHFYAESTGIIRDEMDAQKEAMQKALDISEVLLVSGGSSVGERDYTLEVIRSFPDHQILFHGLAIRPGNPTIFASIGSKWVFGLPGQPVSSLIVFYQFVLPFLFHLSGTDVNYPEFHERRFQTLSARLAENVKPLKTKTDYVRVRLQQTAEGLLAYPVPGKSASLSTLALAHGYITVPPGEHVLQKGAEVRIVAFP